MITIEPRKTFVEMRKSGILIFDWSMLSEFIRCPRAFFHRHEEGLIRRDSGVAFALLFGQGLHLGLQYWAPSKREPEDAQKAVDVFVKFFDPYEEPEGITKAGNVKRAQYTTIFGASLLHAYFDTWRDDSRKIIDVELVVAEEFMPDVYYGGRIDKLMEDPRGYRYADYKSTKYMDDFVTVPNPQFMGYKFLMEKLTGEKVSGELDILGVSLTKPVDQLLRRTPIDYSKDLMDAWHSSMKGVIEELLECRRKNFWPQKWNCKPYFRDCAYLSLCSSSVQASFDAIKQSMYRVEFWDPFETAD